MKNNPVLLKAASSILIILGAVSLVLIGIAILEMMGYSSIFAGYSNSFNLFIIIFELVGAGLLLATGIFGLKKDYDKADRFGKVLLIFTLCSFVFKDGLVLNLIGLLLGFKLNADGYLETNFISIIWMIIVALCYWVFSNKIRTDRADAKNTDVEKIELKEFEVEEIDTEKIGAAETDAEKVDTAETDITE